MFIDVHAHLDLLENLDEVIKELERKKILVVSQGINKETNRKSLEYSKKYKCVKAALGLYPDEILKMSDKEISSELEFIEKNKKDIIAIGEIGLDGTYPDIERQKKIFRKLVKLAIKLDIPVIVHSRKAEGLCIEELESLKCKKVIMHCFSGSMSLVKKITDNGWLLSIPANVHYSEHFQKVVSLVEIKNLFCETDSPFLSPLKKFPNNPENVIYSYKKIAEIKNLSLKDIEKKIEDNFKTFINLN